MLLSLSCRYATHKQAEGEWQSKLQQAEKENMSIKWTLEERLLHATRLATQLKDESAKVSMTSHRRMEKIRKKRNQN